MKSNRLLFLSIFAFSMCFFVSFAIADVVEIDSCRVLDTPNMIYVLTKSIRDYSETCFTIMANNVTLNCNGYTVDSNGSTDYNGILVLNHNYTNIKNCILTDWVDGIYTSDCNNVNILNVTVLNSKNKGIEIHRCDYYNITDSVIRNSYYDGIASPYHTNNIYFHNINLSGNGRAGAGAWSNGIRIIYSENSTIQNINSYNNTEHGLYIYGCNNCNITDSIISGNGGYGVRILYSWNIILMDSLISRNNDGVHFYKCNNSLAKNLTLSYSINSGISSSDSHNMNYSNLATYNNSFDGAYLYNCNNFDIDNITTYNNRYGIYINRGSSNIVKDSESYNSSIGLYLINITDFEVKNSYFQGNTYSVFLDNYGGDTYADLYHSEINGTIILDCSYYYPPRYICGHNNIANLYNTTFTNYSVKNSTLNVYWALNVNNPLSASVTIKNSTNDIISSFSDTSKSIWLHEYYVTPLNMKTNSTPHIIEASKEGYEDLKIKIIMDDNKEIVLILQPDSDEDSVPDYLDRCPGTLLPESIPTKMILPNHYAEVDGDKIFETLFGYGDDDCNEDGELKDYCTYEIIDSKYDLSDTYGCSCEQILEYKPGGNRGEYTHGCTKGTMKKWIEQKM